MISQFRNKPMLKKYIFTYTMILILSYIFMSLILSSLSLTLLSYIKHFIYIIIILGTILGTVQLIYKDDETNTHKIIHSIIAVSIEIFVIAILSFGYLSVVYNKEEIVYKDGQKMIKETHSILLSDWVCYYDYSNMFVRSTKERIYEAHDIHTDEYLYTIYYDDQGNIIKKVTNKEVQDDYN